MAIRSFRVRVRDGKEERVQVNMRVEIIAAPGRLTRDEIDNLRGSIADALMTAALGFPYVHPKLSDMKVTR